MRRIVRLRFLFSRYSARNVVFCVLGKPLQIRDISEVVQLFTLGYLVRTIDYRM